MLTPVQISKLKAVDFRFKAFRKDYPKDGCVTYIAGYTVHYKGNYIGKVFKRWTTLSEGNGMFTVKTDLNRNLDNSFSRLEGARRLLLNYRTRNAV